MSAGSRASGSDDEPLVPEDFDDEFYSNLIDRVPEITKALRQKDTHENADNVQRLVICSNRYKSDLSLEQLHCQQLTDEIHRLQEQLENANRLSRMDQNTIAELRKVIESAWKQKDAAQLREQVAQDEVLKLREKVDILEQTVEHLSDKRIGLQTKRDDQKERDRLNNEIKDLNRRLQIQRLYTTEVESMTHTLEEKNKTLAKLLDETSTEAYSGRKRIDALQQELKQFKSEVIKAKELIAQMRSQNEHLTKLKVRQNLQILSLKTNLEHLHTQHNTTSNKLAKATVELEYAEQDRDRNKRELNQRINLLKVREEEIVRLRRDNAQLNKSEESTARKYATLNDAKRAVEKELNQLRIQLNTQEKEIASLRRLVQQFEKNSEHLVQERDLLKRDLLVEHQAVEETDEQFQESQHQIKSLQDTIHAMELQQQKKRDEYNKVKHENKKKTDEIQALLDKMDALKNDIHLKENYEIELKRTISDVESRCGKFKAQHDALLNEKNALQRSLQAVEDEKAKHKQQIEQLHDNIEALKGKVSYRNSEIGRLQLQLDKMEKERRLLRAEMRQCQLGAQHLRAELLEKKKECDSHTKAQQEDVKKLACLKKEQDHLIDEKNAVAATLTRRNEEYTQLKDELQNLQTVYDQTAKQFFQSQEDMRLMRIEIKNLRTERNVLRKDRESAADLRQEVLQMHRLLNQERIKARAFQEEMMTPMNVHRWRSLKGKDPEKMDLIQRIQVLRKQILNQNVTALEQERALEESQRLYAALKEFMLKLPSHKIRAELNNVKATLSSKEKKLKALTAELLARNQDEKVSASKLEEVKVDLINAKTQLNDEKRKKQKLLEQHQLLVQMQAQCFSAPPNVQRTLGAGFKVIGGI